MLPFSAIRRGALQERVEIGAYGQLSSRRTLEVFGSNLHTLRFYSFGSYFLLEVSTSGFSDQMLAQLESLLLLRSNWMRILTRMLVLLGIKLNRKVNERRFSGSCPGTAHRSRTLPEIQYCGHQDKDPNHDWQSKDINQRQQYAAKHAFQFKAGIGTFLVHGDDSPSRQPPYTMHTASSTSDSTNHLKRIVDNRLFVF
jgi:hypothetical protein